MKISNIIDITIKFFELLQTIILSSSSLSKPLFKYVLILLKEIIELKFVKFQNLISSLPAEIKIFLSSNNKIEFTILLWFKIFVNFTNLLSFKYHILIIPFEEQKN